MKECILDMFYDWGVFRVPDLFVRRFSNLRRSFRRFMNPLYVQATTSVCALLMVYSHENK